MENEGVFHAGSSHMGIGFSFGMGKPRARRNVWTEKKNAALVEIVKNCPYPTPWRPKHGTNKEVWIEITQRMAEHPDIFDYPVHWEAAKEQLLKIIERQKMRRSLGDYEAKSTTERFIDDMIKHMIAEDAEKAAISVHQKGKRDLESQSLESDRKRRSIGMDAASPLTEGLLHFSSNSLKGALSADNCNDTQVEAVFLKEKERIRREFEVLRERIRADSEEESEIVFATFEQMYDKFYRDQEIASSQMLQETQSMVNKLMKIVNG